MVIYFIIVFFIILILYNLVLYKKNNVYLVSIVLNKNKNNYRRSKGTYLNLHNNNRKYLFVPTGSNRLDKVIMKKDNKFVDIADKTNIASLNNTIGCIRVNTDKNGYDDLITMRENSTILYKNNKNGQFTPIKLLDHNNLYPNNLYVSKLNNLNNHHKGLLKNKHDDETKIYHFILKDDKQELIDETNNKEGHNAILNHLLVFKNIKQNNIEKFSSNLEDNEYETININESEQKDIFELELPLKLKDSQVIVETKNDKHKQIFNGYLLTFKINNCDKIDNIKIIKPNNKKLQFSKKRGINVNSRFIVIPVENINEKYKSVVSYYNGKRSSPAKKSVFNQNKIYIPENQNCKRLNNLDYNYNHIEHVKHSRNNNTYLRNNFKECDKYVASYKEGTRGSNYYDIKVNKFKAPIYIGSKNTNIINDKSCILHKKYQRLNNKDFNYNLNLNKSNHDDIRLNFDKIYCHADKPLNNGLNRNELISYNQSNEINLINMPE